MKILQKTLKKKISITGISLHSGLITTINLIPLGVDKGIVFKRTDLNNSRPIPAIWSNVKVANLCTMIENSKKETISTIEHLMFAFYAIGLTNVFVEVDGPEIPILDGSAKLFIDEIIKSGISIQDKEVSYLKIKKKIIIKEEKKIIKFEPTNSNYLEVDYLLNYNDKLIKKQRKHIKNIQKNFKQIYNARTFCHQEDLEKIFAMGLARGGSLDNAIVISGKKVLNQNGLRYDDEFVRHKILDCVGDLYLSGYFLNGKITCEQGGHELTYKLLKKIFLNKSLISVENKQVITDNNYSSDTKSSPGYKFAI